MQWASPIWLIGLIPWAMLAVWLCLGKLSGRGVPFLPLWQKTSTARKAQRQFQRPPLATVLVLLAMLLALLAAGRPFSKRFGGSITLILDRGITMSAMHKGKPRFVEATEQLSVHLSRDVTVNLVDLFGSPAETLNGLNWLDAVRAKSRTAMDSKPMLQGTIAQALAEGQEPVVVLTDHKAPIRDARLTMVRPSGTVVDVGILAIAARATPVAQVMVSVRNYSTVRQCELTVRSGEQSVRQNIKLPGIGQAANYFVDLRSLSQAIEAKLSVQDDLSADDAAWLVRTTQPMRWEVRGVLGEALQRMVQVYGKVKPAAADGPVAAIVNNVGDLVASDAGIVVPTGPQAPVSGELKITTDPLTAVVDWKAATAGASVRAAPAGDWTPLVKVGDAVLVAKRESPGRQVWVGFSQSDWVKRPDFVVFWTNVMDWAAGDAVQWSASPVRVLGREWNPVEPLPSGVQANAWPGIYQNGAQRIAMNAYAPDFTDSVSDEPVNFTLPRGSGERSWASYLLLAAIACGVLSVAVTKNARPGVPDRGTRNALGS
jgi:hypothetical protein